MEVSKKDLYSIVVPVYNSDQSVVELVERIGVEFENVVKADYEIILVDDGSTNKNTWPTLRQLNGSNDKVTSVRLAKNFGQHSAILCGIKLANGDLIITMDDDLQHPPEEIHKLVELKNHDVVVGNFNQRYHSIYKAVLSRLFKFLGPKFFGRPKNFEFTTFVLFKRNIARHFTKIISNSPVMGSILFSITDDIVNVNIKHAERVYGKSGYTFRKMMMLFENIMFANTTVFLRMARFLGLFLSIGSLIIESWMYFNGLYNVSQFIRASVFLMVLFIIGAFLISFGVFGEYLLRILSTIEKKPIYVIKQQKTNRSSYQETQDPVE